MHTCTNVNGPSLQLHVGISKPCLMLTKRISSFEIACSQFSVLELSY